MSQHRLKTLEFKEGIYQLYCVEGRSLSYISNLFGIRRKTMTEVIKGEWGFEQANKKQITYLIEDSISRNKTAIIDYCKNSEERTLNLLLSTLNIKEDHLRTLRSWDADIAEAVRSFVSRPTIKSIRDAAFAEKVSLWEEDMKDLDGEVWMDVVGYEGIYWVSNLARIKNNRKVLKPCRNPRHNRYSIGLSKDGEVKRSKRYRVVATAFIPNPDNLPTVNHKDGDTTNDIVSNLEWSSYKEQNEHRNKVLKRPTAKAYAKNGKFSAVVIDGKYTFKTLKAAARFLDVSETTIQRYVSGESQTDKDVVLIY